MSSSSIAKGYRVICLGQPLMDITIHISDEFLAHMNLEKGGARVIEKSILDDILSKGKKSSASSYTVAPGGSGCNVLKGMAALLDQKKSCALIGKLGKISDPISKIYKDNLHEQGVSVVAKRSTTTETGMVLCLITPDGQRTMRSFLGASVEMTKENLFITHFKQAQIIHIEGYAMYYLNVALETIKMAKKCNTVVAFDCGSFEIVRNFGEQILKMVKNYVDILFCNEDEAASLYPNKSPEEACFQLARYCAVSVVMNGSNGSYVACNINTIKARQHETRTRYLQNRKFDKSTIKPNASFFSNTLNIQLFHCPASPIQKLVDTTGAGDSFTAGFLYGFIEGYPLRKCAYLGSLCGAAVVQIEGANMSQNTWRRLKQKVIKSAL